MKVTNTIVTLTLTLTDLASVFMIAKCDGSGKLSSKSEILVPVPSTTPYVAHYYVYLCCHYDLYYDA